MSYNTVWTRRQSADGDESWGTGTQTVEVAAEELAAMRARLEELEAKVGSGAATEAYNDQPGGGGPPPPGMGLPSGTPPPGMPPPPVPGMPPPPGGLGPAVQRVDFSAAPSLPVGPLGLEVEPTPKRLSQFDPVVEASERDFAASVDTRTLRASFSLRNAAPAPLEGTLFKKSPSGPVYQERPFALADGVLSYVTGKGEAHMCVARTRLAGPGSAPCRPPPATRRPTETAMRAPVGAAPLPRTSSPTQPIPPPPHPPITGAACRCRRCAAATSPTPSASSLWSRRTAGATTTAAPSTPRASSTGSRGCRRALPLLPSA